MRTPSPPYSRLNLAPPSADRFNLRGGAPRLRPRYFSACPSDSASRRTPCPSGTASGGFRSALAVSDFRLRARLGFSIPSSLPASEELSPLLDTALLIRAPEGLEPS